MVVPLTSGRFWTWLPCSAQNFELTRCGLSPAGGPATQQHAAKKDLHRCFPGVLVLRQGFPPGLALSQLDHSEIIAANEWRCGTVGFPRPQRVRGHPVTVQRWMRPTPSQPAEHSASALFEDSHRINLGGDHAGFSPAGNTVGPCVGLLALSLGATSMLNRSENLSALCYASGMDPLLILILVVLLSGIMVSVVASRRRAAARLAYGAVPPSGRSNTLALVAFILSFFVSVPAVVCAHVALAQIGKTGDSGRGFAIAGLVIGYLAILAAVIVLAVYLSLVPR